MSPIGLRRYRAERLLRRDFEALQGCVLAAVRARLRVAGATLAEDELEGCYATAWQGLYAALLDGQEIANPPGWLVLVTYRRALEEHRSLARAERMRTASLALAPAGRGRWGRAVAHAGAVPGAGVHERDLAADLDDRRRLRQLFEGLRGRLDEREREAAVLCYLQGLPRAEAAARMGLSPARMRKLMEGRGAHKPGVAAKVGALVRSISEDDWCEQQGSLMRGLAFGILDPDGERHRLALAHSEECSACRAYVASLRGLAAVLPPALLPLRVGAGAIAHFAGAARSAGAGAAPAAHLGRGLSAAGPGGASAGVAGAGAGASGGWLLAGGPLGAKLALGCLLAMGVGAGCVALGGSQPPAAHAARHRARRVAPRARMRVPGAPLASAAAPRSAPARVLYSTGRVRAGAVLTSAARASREFGPESSQAAATPAAPAPGTSGVSSSGAHLASAAHRGGASAAAPPQPLARVSAPGTAAAGAGAAMREFSPG